MTQKSVVIYIHSDGIHYSWVILDAANNITDRISKGDIHQLSVTKDHEIYVIVPAESVFLTSVTLPKLSKPRLLQALPFALEEQLIEDVGELHFAVGEYRIDGSLPVAVIAKDKMAAWIQFFDERQLSPRAFIPAMFCLPYSEKAWQINSYEQNAIVRTGKWSGFGCESDNLETLLDLKLADEPNRDAIELFRTEFSPLSLLEQLSPHLEKANFINLLQSGFQAKPQGTKIKKIWMLACGLALAAILFAFVGNIISYFILSRDANKIETEINHIYKHNFPNATSIVAPRQRLTEKLRSLSGQAGKNAVLVILGKLTKSLNEIKGITIKNMDFREQQMTLDVLGESFDSLDGFSKNLMQQGLNVKQQNAATQGSQVKATLLIRTGGS